MPNVKSVELAQPGPGVDGGLPNVPCQSIGDGRHKAVKLPRRSLSDHLDPAIGQISHKACHLKALGQTSGRLAKADPLHVAAVKRLSSFQRR